MSKPNLDIGVEPDRDRYCRACGRELVPQPLKLYKFDGTTGKPEYQRYWKCPQKNFITNLFSLPSHSEEVQFIYNRAEHDQELIKKGMPLKPLPDPPRRYG